ncbi:MAG TPA: hypothetical protein VK781_03860 [Solirubrobacteraceae bacterium]|jgi:hypothetical protein|nr:hypothetical protein [Solirubrobacteraceae bacterium]
MEQLPYIDEHSIQIDTTAERVWGALISVLRTDLGRPARAPLTRALGVTPGEMRGAWGPTVVLGDTLPGFAVADVDAPRRLALRGHHRFSRYALTFELTGTESGCGLRARTSAEFPGLTGGAYRALVIGTRAHRLIVRRLLFNVARRA